MKNFKSLNIACIVFVIFFVGNCWATTITVDRVTGYYSGDGGEFNVAGLGNDSLYSSNVLVFNRYNKLGFESFCLEYSEHISIPGTYIAVENSKKMAVGGGAGASGGGDVISQGAAFLYYQFAKGLLASSYDYTAGSGRVASASQLQATLWWLEDEQTIKPTNSFMDLLVVEFGDLDTAKMDLTTSSDYWNKVGVLNLYTRSGEKAQDQYTLVPIPEPSVLMLLGFGLMGVAAGFAKRKQ